MKDRLKLICALAVILTLGVGITAAQTPIGIARADDIRAIQTVQLVSAPAVDLQVVTAEDIDRDLAGLAPRYAIANAVSITPERDGIWEDLGDGTLIWRVRAGAPGAISINLGFGQYVMTPNGSLRIYSVDGQHVRRPFTAVDNALHGELWTPLLITDEIVVEVVLPAEERDNLRLELTSVNVGYREFGSDNRSGSCNVDVICPDGDGWRGEIPSVAAISTGGSLFCSGFMVNNTAQDTTPYFMTAYHCGISAGNAASLVTYWNYETDSCGGARNGSLNQFQTGSFFRSRWSTSDFALVEMDSDPDPAWGVTFAGWNRSGAEATTAVAIHHPSVDEKAISFEFDATTTTSYLGTSVPGNGTHVRVADWDTGTTEGGSSGSPLFNQNHQVIGQLHGGYAACGNNSADWYGKFSVSWNGGGTSSTRLSTWLDPGNTGANSVNTLVVGGCSNNGDCDDGAFCNGAETCGGGGSCQPGNDPCPGQACNESNDSCEPLVCNNDGTCDAGEDCNNCGDDCISGTGVSCGDGVCETAAGEDCFSCPSDCNGKTNGNPNNRYCCGNGTPCTDSRCSNNGNICTTSGGGMSYCCGDMACQGDENNSNCSIDCGPPPVCGDNVCDVGAGEDCASCAADCCGSCDPVGTSCIDDSDCCSNKCKGPSGGKTCK